MKKLLIALILATITVTALGQIIQSPLDVDGRPHFEFPQPVNGVYEGDIELPRLEKGGLIIVDGQGKTIILGPNSHGITTPVTDGESPLSETRTRYLIKNFSAIIGGKTAINLTATFNSIIENIEVIGQSEVAINLGFCLMCEVRNVLITNPANDGIYVGIGNFPGWTGASNAQSNQTTLTNVRVYNRPGTTGNSLTIENSNGVVVRQCVSEGHPNAGHALEYRGQNATVKHFLIDGFHIESVSEKGAICIDAQANTSNTLNRVYAQKYGRNVPVVVIKNNAPVRLSQWGWFSNQMYIYSDNFAPRIWAENMPSSFTYNSIKTDHVSGRPIYKPYVWINGLNPK